MKFSVILVLAVACIVTVSGGGDGGGGGGDSGGGGSHGIDISTGVTENEFRCLRSEGVDFVIVRAYRSNGRPDSNAVQNIVHARAASLDVDVYMFPCPKCSKTAQQQVDEMFLNLGNSNFGQVWLDIEEDERYDFWSQSYTTNRQFFEQLLSAAIRGNRPGVYARRTNWNNIMGSSYTGGSSYDLWYVDWDSDPSFRGFRSFGGWGSPTIKQYRGDVQNYQNCGVQVDLNWKE